MSCMSRSYFGWIRRLRRSKSESEELRSRETSPAGAERRVVASGLSPSVLVEQAGQRYRQTLQDFIRAQAAEDSRSVGEVLLALPDRPDPYSLWRVDLLRPNRDGEYDFVELSPGQFLSLGQPMPLLQAPLPVTLHPISWHGIQFWVSREPEDCSAFEQWTRRWIDANDEGEASQDTGLVGRIHNVTSFESAGGSWWMTSVDFGSAEADAFWELLDVFSEMRVGAVHAGSFHLDEVPEPTADALSET